MREITASEFKATCLKLLDEVNESGEMLVVTKHGKPVARVLPAEPKKSIIGRGVGKGRIIGDIESPIEDWDENDGDWENVR